MPTAFPGRPGVLLPLLALAVVAGTAATIFSGGRREQGDEGAPPGRWSPGDPGTALRPGPLRPGGPPQAPSCGSARVRGTVRTPSGDPAPGVHVLIGPSPEAPGAYWRRGATTGPDGTYAVEGVPRGGSVRLRGIPLDPWGPRNVAGQGGIVVAVPADADVVEADLVFVRPAVLRIAWKDLSGRSGEPATVTLIPPPPEQPWWSHQLRRLDTAVFPGRWRVQVAGSSACGEASVEVAPGEERDVVVPLGAGPALEGAVIRGDGTPVAGALVEAVVDAPDGDVVLLTEERLFTGAALARDPPRPDAVRSGGEGPSADASASSRSFAVFFGPMVLRTRRGLMPGAKGRAWTDAEGRFRIEGVETGSRWLLRARGNGVEGAGPLPVEAPAAGIRVAVRACGAVTGRLVPRGAIEPGTNRAFRYRRGEERRGMPDRPSGTLHRVDAFGDGSFRVEGLPPGPGTLLVSADGREFEPVRIEVPEGGVFEAGDVVESAAAPRGPR